MNSSCLNFDQSRSNIYIFLLGTFGKYEAQGEIIANNLTWLLFNCLILFLERYNSKKYYSESL